MKVALISTYELGRQPFGLASPAAWLKNAGATVACQDLAIETFDPESVADADLIGFYVPMHTATRLAAELVGKVVEIAPKAHLCFYGLYAPINETYLRALGADTILGGEFEEGLLSLFRRLQGANGGLDGPAQPEPTIALGRQKFLVPDRSGLPVLDNYAKLKASSGELHTVGYTEASRGCKHLCRHCPVVPVYQGNFRIVQREVVLEDVRQQVAAGARHITFGDPDFFNGPTHAVKLVKAMHEEFPQLTYDATIKVEHLLNCAQHLPTLRETGCSFVISAVESVDNAVLKRVFDKGHTREDFVAVVELFRKVGLNLNPTFVTFHPWITVEGYCDFLDLVLRLGLVNNIAPIQYAIRLLIPEGSRLLELPEVQDIIEEFDDRALVYPWHHPDPRVDRLCNEILYAVQEGHSHDDGRREVFSRVWGLAHQAAGDSALGNLPSERLNLIPSRVEIPYLTEPWYC